MSYDYRYIPYNKNDMTTNVSVIEELKEKICDLSYEKHDAWWYMRRNIDEYLEMLKSLNTLEDEIELYQSRLEKVRSELSRVNEEIESLR